MTGTAHSINFGKLSNIQDLVWRQCVLPTLFSHSSWFGKTVSWILFPKGKIWFRPGIWHWANWPAVKMNLLSRMIKVWGNKMVLFLVKCFYFHITAFCQDINYYDFTFLLASRFFRLLTFLRVDSSSELIISASSPEWLWPCDGDLGASSSSSSSSSSERLPFSLSSLSSPISASNKSSFSKGWSNFRKQNLSQNLTEMMVLPYKKCPCFFHGSLSLKSLLVYEY